MYKSSISCLFLSLLALLVACGGGADENSLEAKKKKLEEKLKAMTELKAEVDQLETEIAAMDDTDPKEKLRKIGVTQLSPRKFEHYIEVQGEVKSDQNVEVQPDISGRVIARKAQEGQTVKKGQTLLVLDADLVQRNIEEVETRLELATTLYERQANLHKQNIGSEVQYLQAKNEKESLERSLATLRTQLEDAYVTAPISGTIDEFFINPGEMANPAVSVARIVNLSKVEVSAEVSEAYTQEVKRRDSVTVKFPSLDLDVPATIDVVGQFINPLNRSFRIEIGLDNRKMQVKPNTMTLVQIKDFEQENAVVVPSYLIQKSTNGEKFLFVAEKKSDTVLAKKTIIEIGKTYQGFTHVKSGLSANANIITDGYNEVTDGEEVNIVKREDLAMKK